MWEYDTAQICLNGHVVNSAFQYRPQDSLKFCQQCGAETLTRCSSCAASIRGATVFGNGQLSELRSAPAFCHECGAAYPWTAKRLKAARALAEEIDGLDEADRAILATSLDDLLRDTPDATVAAVRFKKILKKSGEVVGQGFKDILVDVVSETVKKLIWP